MKAILLSAGKGSRLGFVKKIPKALLKIKSKTIKIWIEKMISIGVTSYYQYSSSKKKIEKFLDKKFPIKLLQLMSQIY